jgi:hypothetical protein
LIDNNQRELRRLKSAGGFMGKAHVAGWVEDDQKDAIECAAKRIIGSDRSVTPLLREFGTQLRRELETLPQDVELALDVRLVVKNGK